MIELCNIPSPLTVNSLTNNFLKASGVFSSPSGVNNCCNTYGYAPLTRRNFGSTLSAKPSNIVKDRIITVKNGGVLKFSKFSWEMTSNSAWSLLKFTSDPLPVPPVELM